MSKSGKRCDDDSDTELHFWRDRMDFKIFLKEAWKADVRVFLERAELLWLSYLLRDAWNAWVPSPFYRHSNVDPDFSISSL